MLLIQNAVIAVAHHLPAQRLLESVFAQAAGGQGSPFGTVGMLAAMFVIFYFLILRPQSKQAKERKAMIAALKKGDAVIIGGGMVGRIHAVAEKTLMVEIAQGVRVRVLISSVNNKAPEGLLEEEAKPEAKIERKLEATDDKSEKDKK